MDFKKLDIEHETLESGQIRESGIDIDSYQYEEENNFTFDNDESQFKGKPVNTQSIEVDEEPVPEEKLRLLAAYFKDVGKEFLAINRS